MTADDGASARETPAPSRPSGTTGPAAEPGSPQRGGAPAAAARPRPPPAVRSPRPGPGSPSAGGGAGGGRARGRLPLVDPRRLWEEEGRLSNQNVSARCGLAFLSPTRTQACHKGAEVQVRLPQPRAERWTPGFERRASSSARSPAEGLPAPPGPSPGSQAVRRLAEEKGRKRKEGIVQSPSLLTPFSNPGAARRTAQL